MAKKRPYSPGKDVESCVKAALTAFMQSLGRDLKSLNPDTDLLLACDASSDEGLDFALELEDALGIRVPLNFNPFVHCSGRRGLTFGELTEHVGQMAAAASGDLNGK